MDEKLITHYTSDIGFEGIIKNKCLWFTDIRYLNDYYERQLYINGVKECLKLYYDENINSQLKSFNDDLLQIYNSAVFKRRVFVFSCSLDEDNLALWNYYSKNSGAGGYNLTFDLYELLASIVNDCPENQHFINVLCGNMRYNYEDLKSHLEYANKYSLHFLSTIKTEGLLVCLLERSMPPEKLQQLNHEELVQEIKNEYEHSSLLEDIKKYKHFDCANGNIYVERFSKKGLEIDYLNMEAFFKQQFFQIEKEIRIVIEVDDNKIPILEKAGIYKTRLSRGLFVPYLDIPIALSSIRKIKISPMNYHSNCVSNVEEFVGTKGYFPEVSKSLISVNY